MIDLRLTNSLTRTKEKFEALNPPKVTVYTCGPTVYSYPTIGNWRTYALSDLTIRTLKYLGYEVEFYMNLTDVGHLTGDNEGDANTGDDRLERAAKREGKTAWDVAEFYTHDFEEGYKKLNLTQPIKFTRATEYIAEQIDLVKKIEEKGFAYKISDGIYFDVAKYESSGYKYGELSNLDQIKEGARVEVNPEKHDPRDFALWKFSPSASSGLTRDMEWESPWGVGFPGWHIECSAMSMKYLGETLDIHIGGEDLRSTHHPNEIAQSESVTGKRFVNYWLHGAFLTVDGGRMGKSIGNAYTLADIEEKGYDVRALKYLFLTSHYRNQLNFTWEALTAAGTALSNLESSLATFRSNDTRTVLSTEKEKKTEVFGEKFTDAICDDLNFPKALAVVWEVVKSNIPSEDKYDLILSFDEVLGLNLGKVKQVEQVVQVELEVQKLIDKRQELRLEGKFEEADEVRKQVETKGYAIKDTSSGVEIKKIG